ncbi:M3 family metallopeptidase [Nocardioides bizhenqiangii]|uniref:M3 family metallopeptidase n=1 Tax=Nocardioides bizhenqiangii TaxID=3095076 RepID=A0ABZ0ZRU5_9ACTN|nr:MULTISPECIES: M3 family metallopeptidase [unclassified Nocardioides]MDZ5619479.1 M3 family metallopeptidase [Nocardioides sp. HM23]WQQ26504.1 M3 family metallopeptidase [Nocardioides sp. HM61]
MSHLEPLNLPETDDAATWGEWVRSRSSEELDRARTLVDRLRTDPPAEALEVLRLWDHAAGHLGGVAASGSLFGNVHPDQAVRDVADAAEQDADKLSTEWSLDRTLYEVFAGLAEEGLDATSARLLEKVRKDFRRSGVDRDDETRSRISAIRDRLTELDQEFSKLTRDDVRSIKVAPDRLAGLPDDWLAAHPAGDDGLVTVTTDYPDAIPVRMFAHDQDVRRDIVIAFLQRGWPDAEPLLEEMFALRQELASLVGYDDWPSYDADVKMIGSGSAIPEFIEKIAAAAAEPMRADLDTLLERYRRDHPDATEIPLYDSFYYQERVRQEQFDVDAQQVRAYFAFPKVRQGLLDVTGRLFGLRYERADVPVWHEDVAAYDVFRGDDVEPLGRIYLDLHPREGKYKHAAQFTLTDGVAGDQLPEGVLVCNFSRGLMEHDHVVTLFHEFGHLLHHVLAGHGEWFRFAGVATEWDFVEAPSQMLEEWAWDPAVLRSFATNDAGEPIPVELVEAMRRSDDYGKGIYARTQMFYAAMSYWFHADEARRAAGEEVAPLSDRMVDLQRKYAALPYLEGTHMFASFGHLGGYSSAYYTYMWSLVIAKDMFSAFDADGPGDLFSDERLAVATRYRDAVLAPGGTKDAADLVADFLGRPYSFDSYSAWLAR